MKQYMILIILLLNCVAFTQKTVSVLNPKHAIALRDFFDANQQYSFLSEVLYDEEYLKDLRKERGKTFLPYYKTGDFNWDGIQDFAMFVKREGKPEPLRQSSPIDYAYPMSLVVFNGDKNGKFYKAFVKDESNPYVMYLDMTVERKKRLFYAMDGGLGGTALTPVGSGYIAEDIYH